MWLSCRLRRAFFYSSWCDALLSFLTSAIHHNPLTHLIGQVPRIANIHIEAELSTFLVAYLILD